MPDVSCQTLMVHISSLRWEDTQDALNKIFDQGIRSNMRLQDVRSRLKDLQDDMRVVKRHLNLEDAQGKRLKLAVDQHAPVEGCRPSSRGGGGFFQTRRGGGGGL